MWANHSAKPSRRFSYLLLEEGDHYIQDWIATCRQGSAGGSQRLHANLWQQRSLRGRLRLCAKCFFFEPDYVKAPMLMFRFTDVKKVEMLADPPSSQLSTGKWKNRQEGFSVDIVMIVEMKENGLDAPYRFKKGDSTWWFSLEFSTVQPLLQQVQSLLSINALPYAERNMVLHNAAAQREAQAQFDITRLVDLSERVILNLPAAQVTPLVREPGRLVLTQERLYFQLDCCFCPTKTCLAAHWDGTFFWDEKPFRSTVYEKFTSGLSVFYTFQSVEKRDIAFKTIREQLGGHRGVTADAGTLFETDGCWLQRVTAAWQARIISNYDYLLYLNLAAGRSFCDLTQWPVMPWILSDYKSKTLNLNDSSVYRDLSKPVGALNPSRLELFRQRYTQMPQGDPANPPFLYGTHYSTPGYVLYWVVRSAPAHMLRLQNGRFDAPDRLFVNISDSWDSVLSNHADLKELIPEFFSPPSDFLLMRDDLDLGVRQNGSRVGDVILPPWANSPDDFITKHRQALESEHVSMHLHEWIDLIFGYKQRGEAALAADNLFHYLTYEGAVDLEGIDDPTQRAGIEAQINEFGQAPKQLFDSFHPARFPRPKQRNLSVLLNQSDSLPESFGGVSSDFVSRLMALAFPVSGENLDECTRETLLNEKRSPELSAFTAQDSNQLGSIEEMRESARGRKEDRFDVYPRQYEDFEKLTLKGSPLKKQAAEAGYSRQTLSFGNELDNIEETFVVVDRLDAASEDDLEVFDRNLSRFKGNFVREGSRPWYRMFRQRLPEPQTLKLHRGPVNALVLSAENASEVLTLYSAGKDGYIKVYSVTEGFQVRATKLGNLPLAALALAASCDAYPVLFDDCVYAYSVDYGRALGKIRAHDDTVSCVKVPGKGNLRMITGSWDATVKVWSIEEGRGGWAAPFSSVGGSTDSFPDCDILEHEVAVWCLDVADNGHLGVSGCEDGTIKAWDLRTSPSVVWQNSAGASSVAGLKLTGDASHVVTACRDGCMRLLEMRQAGAELASKDCRSPLKCCDIAGPLAISGCDDGALHFWPLQAISYTDDRLEDSGNEFLDFSPIRDHSDSINCIFLDKGGASGPTLATASEDTTIQVYRVGRS